jgi:hypothetical protein
MNPDDLCGVDEPSRPFNYYCTRPKGHDGPHIATIGPYEPDRAVLARWWPVQGQLRFGKREAVDAVGEAPE